MAISGGYQFEKMFALSSQALQVASGVECEKNVNSTKHVHKLKREEEPSWSFDCELNYLNVSPSLVEFSYSDSICTSRNPPDHLLLHH